MSSSFPPARGERLRWSALPAAVTAALEAEFGADVTDAVIQPEGFSPAVAARVVLGNGRRLFLKATGPVPNPDAPGLYRAERDVAARLPASVPAPRLLWGYDDGAWVALAFEDVDGRTPALPWRPDELGRVLDAMVELADALTPSPVALGRIQSRLAAPFHAWRDVQAAGGDAVRVIGELDGWAFRNLDRLAGMEASWEEAAAGTTLVHGDIRADNVVLTPGRVVFVDWPWASIGATWTDLLFFLPSVAMQGGGDIQRLFEAHPLGRQAPPDSATAVLAALAGFLAWGSCQSPPPGLPTLRAFQAGQAREALSWLRLRTGWR